MPQKRFKDKKYLEWVTSLPCLLCKAGYYSHSKEVQAHHLLKPYDGVRGMSLKASDKNVIPLCYHHHALLHTKYGDEYKFFASFGLPKTFGQDWAKKLWEERSLHETDENNDLPF